MLEEYKKELREVMRHAINQDHQFKNLFEECSGIHRKLHPIFNSSQNSLVVTSLNKIVEAQSGINDARYLLKMGLTDLRNYYQKID